MGTWDTGLYEGDYPAALRDDHKVQRKLAQAGYYHYTGLDGSFGAQTEAAVKVFQAANGLEPGGSVGARPGN